jgi:hypothetical protein
VRVVTIYGSLFSLCFLLFISIQTTFSLTYSLLWSFFSTSASLQPYHKMKFNLFTTASAALTFVSVVHAQDQCSNGPSCTNTTSFVYAGCFQDPSSPRALPFSGPSNSNMTVETCVAFCKGMPQSSFEQAPADII